MPQTLFSADNGEELVAVARLGLGGVDYLMGFVPSHDAMPSAELAALMRLLSATLNLGIEVQQASNGQLGPP